MYGESMITGKKIKLFAITCSLLLATLACTLSGAKPNHGGSSSAGAPTSAILISDPATAIHNVLQAAVQAPAYHASLSVNSNGSTTRIEGDVILPDKFHITTTHDAKTSEFIVVGGRSYNKVNGSWAASSFDLADLAASFTGVLSQDTSITEAKFVQMDSVAGKPALVYSFNAQYKTGDLVINSATTMWVDSLSGLPVKLVVDSQASGIKSHTEEAITYDPDITIEAPGP
jgi:hypothetical protein